MGNADKIQAYEYFMTKFKEDSKMHKKVVKSTGLMGLDSMLSIFPGLYLLGGAPSVGKTALATQLSDTFAKQGKQILFFISDKSYFDIVRSSVSRIIKNDDSAVDAQNIYASFAKNIYYISPKYRDHGIGDVLDLIQEHITKTKEVPIVFIDNLQHLHVQSAITSKSEIAQIGRDLSVFAKNHGVAIFLLCGLNRFAYNLPLDYDAYKDTEDIEYMADVILGLQYRFVKESLSTMNETERRQYIINEKGKDVKEIELVCVKNKFGRTNQQCNLLFDSKYYYFEDA